MRVTKTFVHDHEGPIFTVSIDGTEIKVTGNHPICVAEGIGLSARSEPHDIGDDPLDCGNGGRWVEADELMIGDTVVGVDGIAIISNIASIGSSVPVYNIQVEGTHTYAVGASGLLVHNKPAMATLGRLTSAGGGSWRSTAGLVYGPGSAHGNRVAHVLAHAAPDASKPIHSVFNVGRKNVLGLVDEAWLSRGAPLANDPGAFVVPMGRVIGTAGETAVKIVVRPGTSRVVTAFPVFP